LRKESGTNISENIENGMINLLKKRKLIYFADIENHGYGAIRRPETTGCKMRDH